MQDQYRTIILRELLEEQINEFNRNNRRIAELHSQDYAPIKPWDGPRHPRTDFMFKPRPENEELYRLETKRPVLEMRIRYLKELI